MTETNGVIGFPPVRETLGQMAAEVSMVEGLVESMEISGSKYGKLFRAEQTAALCGDGADSAAISEVCAVDSRVCGWRNDHAAVVGRETLPILRSRVILKRRSITGDGFMGRVKLFKLAWDAVGSEFGSRHLQYEMFYAGADMVTRGHAFRTYDWEQATGMVDRFMAGYSAGGQETP